MGEGERCWGKLTSTPSIYEPICMYFVSNLDHGTREARQGFQQLLLQRVRVKFKYILPPSAPISYNMYKLPVCNCELPLIIIPISGSRLHSDIIGAHRSVICHLMKRQTHLSSSCVPPERIKVFLLPFGEYWKDTTLLSTPRKSPLHVLRVVLLLILIQPLSRNGGQIGHRPFVITGFFG